MQRIGSYVKGIEPFKVRYARLEITIEPIVLGIVYTSPKYISIKRYQPPQPKGKYHCAPRLKATITLKNVAFLFCLYISLIVLIPTRESFIRPGQTWKAKKHFRAIFYNFFTTFEYSG